MKDMIFASASQFSVTFSTARGLVPTTPPTHVLLFSVGRLPVTTFVPWTWAARKWEVWGAAWPSFMNIKSWQRTSGLRSRSSQDRDQFVVSDPSTSVPYFKNLHGRWWSLPESNSVGSNNIKYAQSTSELKTTLRDLDVWGATKRFRSCMSCQVAATDSRYRAKAQLMSDGRKLFKLGWKIKDLRYTALREVGQPFSWSLHCPVCLGPVSVFVLWQ